ncbi:MAG: hypothetical protein WKF74_02965 [Pyrinomonadaceae bacterium]
MNELTSLEFDDNPLLVEIERLFQEKAPDWKLKSAMYSESDDSKIYCEWQYGEDIVKIQIVAMASPEAAAAHLQMFDWHIPLTQTHRLEMAQNVGKFQLPEPIKPDAKLPDVGDENYVWSRSNEEGESLIKLREGNMIMQVDGSSYDVAERFARLVAEGIRAI